jgi:hypothetical protein
MLFGLPDDVVTRLDKDAAGGIWIATRSGVCRYARGVFTKYPTIDGPSDGVVTAICAGSQHGVFIATGDRLHRLVNEKFEVVKGIVEESDGSIDYLMAGRDGSIWIGLNNGVIKKWKPNSIVRYTSKQNVSPHIHRIYEDP